MRAAGVLQELWRSDEGEGVTEQAALIERATGRSLVGSVESGFRRIAVHLQELWRSDEGEGVTEQAALIERVTGRSLIGSAESGFRRIAAHLAIAGATCRQFAR